MQATVPYQLGVLSTVVGLRMSTTNINIIKLWYEVFLLDPFWWVLSFLFLCVCVCVCSELIVGVVLSGTWILLGFFDQITLFHVFLIDGKFSSIEGLLLTYFWVSLWSNGLLLHCQLKIEEFLCSLCT